LAVAVSSSNLHNAMIKYKYKYTREWMVVLKRLKKAINKFLEGLAKENEKSFGKGTLDCCQINRKSSNSKK